MALLKEKDLAVTCVEALPGYTLVAAFSNGDVRRVDLQFLAENCRLGGEQFLSPVLKNGMVCWGGAAYIDAYDLHELGEPESSDPDGFLVHAMANVPQKVYKLPLAHDVKFNILQPGDLQISHAPRLKVFRGSPRKGPNFSISLVEKPAVVAGESFLTAKELKMVLDHVGKYHAAYRKLWNDDGMDLDDLQREMEAIDLKEKEAASPTVPPEK